MGKHTFTRSMYKAAVASEGIGDYGVTKRAEQKAISTGKLEQLVDPAEFGVIRLSLPRVEQKGELWELLVGTPMPIETRVDTTGSMGDNVDVAMRVLPDAFEHWHKVLETYDIQIATGIFGDVSDRFPLCRPQFEMEAGKIVKQLTLMVPERDGGDAPEDPDIGIFGAAYLVRAYINRIGLKRYDFTVTDAPGRGIISEDQLRRVFGEKVFEKVAENGFQTKFHGSIQLNDVWSVLLGQAHAFVLQVGNEHDTTSFWQNCVGKNRVIKLPDTQYLPHVQTVIMGLTEGTLAMTDVVDLLCEANMNERLASFVAESVMDIPIGAQASLPNFARRPMKGDTFAGKPDVWEDTNIWPENQYPVKSDSEETKSEQDDWR